MRHEDSPPSLKLRRASCEVRQREAGWRMGQDSNLRDIDVRRVSTAVP
jgi:hypothetical protein